MPLTVTGVGLTVTPANQPCPPANKQFTVAVTVNGTSTGIGGTYDVRLYDVDPEPPPVPPTPPDLTKADLLAQLLAVVAVPASLPVTHTFTLFCNDTCEVEGPAGKSGEQRAELQARVSVAGAGDTWSPRKTATCGSGAYRPGRRGKSARE